MRPAVQGMVNALLSAIAAESEAVLPTKGPKTDALLARLAAVAPHDVFLHTRSRIDRGRVPAPPPKPYRNKTPRWLWGHIRHLGGYTQQTVSN